MKTSLFSFLVLVPTLVGVGFAVACFSPPSPQAVAATVSDGTSCAVGILATSAGAPDVADLLKCGLTAADLYALVSSLLKQAQGGDAGAAGAALSPAQATWTAKLQMVKAKLEPPPR